MYMLTVFTPHRKDVQGVNPESSSHGEKFFPSCLFLCLYENMDVSCTYRDSPLTICKSNHHTVGLNLHSDVCQLFSIKLKKRKGKIDGL